MIKKALFLLLALSSSLVACTDEFEELNTDPTRIEKISPGTLLNPILYEMTSFNTDRSAGFTFDLMQVSLPYPSVSGGIHRYDVSESAGNSTWTTYYRWLANLKEMRVAAEAAGDPNYQAIALTLNAWTYSLLTDCFGDVPMTEAARGTRACFTQPSTRSRKFTHGFWRIWKPPMACLPQPGPWCTAPIYSTGTT